MYEGAKGNFQVSFVSSAVGQSQLQRRWGELGMVIYCASKYHEACQLNWVIEWRRKERDMWTIEHCTTLCSILSTVPVGRSPG